MLTSEADGGISERERLRALLAQALAEAHTRGASRITELHMTLWDPTPASAARLRETLQDLSQNTLAAQAQVIITIAPSRFICWNCCGLRFESNDPDAPCPNCGHKGWLIPEEVTFALDHITYE
jgi:Zn finger protein HypA/HybF involved in hydrogenase expression